MKVVPLAFKNGHLFATIDSQDWLLDTGAPTTFGNIESICINSFTFEVPENYMGLNADQLSKFVAHPTAGILGVDVLNNFNVIIDVKNECVSFTKEDISLNGNIIEIDDFMGIPIINANIGGTDRRMFFDTGAQISYFQDEVLNTFPSAGVVTDFYPGVGQFQTETYLVDTIIGTKSFKLRCGALPELLGMTLMIAGTEGIIGNEILNNQIAGYCPNSKHLILA
jgi:hypothetical protein